MPEYSNYIEGRTAAATLDGTEELAISQNGESVKTTTQDIADLGGGGSITSVNGDTGPVVVLDATDVGADPAGSASTVNTALGNHISDATDAHAGTAITNTPAGNISATTVQGAINELDSEKQSAAQVTAAIAPYVITEVSAVTTGGTITLNFQVSSIDRQNVIFVGSASFTGSKTFALSNTTVAKNFFFVFEVTSFAGVAVTVPADWSLSTPDFTTGTTWTPTANGRYRMSGVFVNSLWEVFVDGPASV